MHTESCCIRGLSGPLVAAVRGNVFAAPFNLDRHFLPTHVASQAQIVRLCPPQHLFRSSTASRTFVIFRVLRDPAESGNPSRGGCSRLQPQFLLKKLRCVSRALKALPCELCTRDVGKIKAIHVHAQREGSCLATSFCLNGNSNVGSFTSCYMNLY
jgi:hypothetical protein